MNLLRRWFGGGQRDATPGARPDEAPEPEGAIDLDDLERAHEIEMSRAEQDRLDDLQQRQLRYASYAWQPPSQGGERRADDPDGGPTT